MSKFKIKPTKSENPDTYYISYSNHSVLGVRTWQEIGVWDKEQSAWFVREFNKKRADQVCRQLKSYQDVLTFQAETYK
jgi:hypothetical protein